MEDALTAVSRRVRAWREGLSLSLHELAERSDVAASTIQKVETGQMVPSVAVLMKIARGLDRRPAELVSDEAEEAEIVLMRSKEHAVMSAGSQMRIERLSGDLFDPAVEVWRAYLRPGVGSGKSQHAYEGEEVIICDEGEVTFRFGDDEYRLTAGDTLHFWLEVKESGISESRPDRGRLVLRYAADNQNGDTVVSMLSTVYFMRREA